jgi:hypothetical protein
MNRAEERQQRNRTILDGVGSESANQKHIFARIKQRFERNRLIALALKRIRQDEQHAQTNAELYADDWAYEHGGITEGNKLIFAADCIDRVAQLAEGKRMARERAAERELDGGLMSDFADQGRSITDGLNNEEDQLADALCKADPSLRKYRNDFIK